MWRDLRENQITVSKSLEDITETKPRTRILLSEDILAEFEKYEEETTKRLILHHCYLESVSYKIALKF